MPRHLRGRTLVPFGVLFLSLGTYSQPNDGADQQSPSPQTQPTVYQSSTVLRATTRLAGVDVGAPDSKGEPVPDLKAEDFTVLEDGKPQKISEFTFQRGSAATLVASSRNAGGVSNAPQYKKVNSMNVILFDALNGDFAAHAYGRDELIKFLDKGNLTQPTALYALEEKLTLMHDFTTDVKELKTVLQDFKPKGPEHVQGVYSAASPFTARAPNTNTTIRSMDITMAALNSLARALAGYPGRKNLIWISQGFPLTMFPEIIFNDPNPSPGRSAPLTQTTMAMEPSFRSGSDRDFEVEVEKLANALMNAQVAVYPVDASGLQKDNRLNTINTMRSLADRTGGKAFYNRNDVEVGISSSIDDGSTYYTLEYYPVNKTWDGKFRVIQIKGRSGFSLRYRQGYYALDPGMQNQNKDAEKTLARNFSEA